MALLTGGTGLDGCQIALALSETGATVYIASQNREALEKVAAQQENTHALKIGP